MALYNQLQIAEVENNTQDKQYMSYRKKHNRKRGKCPFCQHSLIASREACNHGQTHRSAPTSLAKGVLLKNVLLPKHAVCPHEVQTTGRANPAPTSFSERSRDVLLTPLAF